MPIATDTHWPERLLNMFSSRPSSRFPVNLHFGRYNALLGYCFFNEQYDYYIAPKTPSLPGGAAFVVIDHDFQPVFFVDIRDGVDADSAVKRLAADKQMRAGYDLLLADCPLPRLWGLSLLGTSMRVYYGDKDIGVVNPPFQTDRSYESVLPSDFIDDWKLNILSAEGFAQVKKIVEYIKEPSRI